MVAGFGIELAGRRLLDVGCGAGGMTEVWRQEGAETVGLDVDAARFTGAEGDFIAGDIRAMPVGGSSFDLVFAHDVLEHVLELPQALEEIARVLVPGGRAFVSFPPFYGPYGGHQQGHGGVAKLIPYGHLLPRRLWLSIASSDAYQRMFDGLGRLSVGTFERMVGESPLRRVARRAYLVRPEVALRTGLPVVESSALAGLATLREFLLGAVFYVLERP